MGSAASSLVPETPQQRVMVLEPYIAAAVASVMASDDDPVQHVLDLASTKLGMRLSGAQPNNASTTHEGIHALEAKVKALEAELEAAKREAVLATSSK